MCHKRIDRRYYRAAALFSKCPDTAHPLLRYDISGNVRLIEYQILCRKIKDIRIIEPVVLIYLSGFCLTKSNDDFEIKIIANSVYHMKFLRIHTAVRGNCSVVLRKYIAKCGIFRKFRKRCIKCSCHLLYWIC